MIRVRLNHKSNNNNDFFFLAANYSRVKVIWRTTYGSYILMQLGGT